MGPQTCTKLDIADAQLTSGSPYWPIHNPAAVRYGKLTDDDDCEVAIIGGGITGALIASRMAGAGLDTVLIDKARFGSGSTSASTALISYEFDLLLSDLIDRIGEPNAVRVYELCYDATTELKQLASDLEDNCDFEDKVAIRITNDEFSFDRYTKEATLRNRDCLVAEVVRRQDLESRFGVSAELGLVSANAAQIDPYRFTHHMISSSVKLGMRAFEESPITRFEPQPGTVLLASDAGTVKAKHVIFATGYESEKYLGSTGATQNTDFCFMSKPLGVIGPLGRCHLVEDAEDYLYVSTFGDRVMVGMEGKTLYAPRDRERLIRDRVNELLARVGVYLPDRDLRVDYSWASTFVNSADSLPFIARSDRYPGAIFALGYGGNGIASSAMLSKILLELVQTGKSADADLFKIGR